MEFNICFSVPNFIIIGQFLTDIWRFKYFQNGVPLQSWILKICSFCYVAFVGMPFRFLAHNFSEIRQSDDEL